MDDCDKSLAPSFYKAMVSEKRNHESRYLHGAEFKKRAGSGRKKLSPHKQEILRSDVEVLDPTAD